MKKKIKKLSLSKRTISNLSISEMDDKLGGSTGCYPHSAYYCGNHTKNCSQNCTRNQATCPGHAGC